MNREMFDSPLDFVAGIFSCEMKMLEKSLGLVAATARHTGSTQTYLTGIMKYISDFMVPYWVALDSFLLLERDKLLTHFPDETSRDYLELLQFNFQIAGKGLASSVQAMNEFCMSENIRLMSAYLNSALDTGEDIKDLSERKARLMKLITEDYPEAIRSIEPKFGFHFENGNYVKAAETDRFIVYQVLPTHRGVEVDKGGKPVLILPPYVLGENILAFLPGEDKSYAHSFANQGIPTYIRAIKDINENPAVQIMTGEDDALDTQYFCSVIRDIHGRKVTLNGFCQGGFIALLDILSGKLDKSVDALITCVAPIDGTRSQSLIEYLQHIPERFRDLGYALKTLPNGNRIVDGKVMSWVYKLKSMEREAPVFSFFRDLKMLDRPGTELKITSTAAALNYWLLYERNDLPLGITQLSFDSYTKPIGSDGTMPVSLFGEPLNIKRMAEKGIPWLICYAEDDDLVDRAAALAPLDFIDAEVTVFPKGHGAIATSWSFPGSECPLHKPFGEGMRGPVCFQLQLDPEHDEHEKTLSRSSHERKVS
jgi:hypothetical protein